MTANSILLYAACALLSAVLILISILLIKDLTINKNSRNPSVLYLAYSLSKLSENDLMILSKEIANVLHMETIFMLPPGKLKPQHKILASILARRFLRIGARRYTGFFSYEMKKYYEENKFSK